MISPLFKQSYRREKIIVYKVRSGLIKRKIEQVKTHCISIRELNDVPLNQYLNAK